MKMYPGQAARREIRSWLTLCLLLAPAVVATPARGQDFPAFETAGHLGGFVNAATVRGDFAYLGQANFLTIVDLARSPRTQVGLLEFPDEPQRIALSGDLAFLTYRGTLEVVDVGEPANPVRLSTTEVASPDTFVSSLAVAGDVLLLVEHEAGLRTIDVSEPTAPRPLGFLGLPARAVVARGEQALAVAAPGELKVFDLGDPASPVEVGAIAVPGAREAFLAAELALVVGGDGQGLTLVDVTRPGSPAVVGSFGAGSHTFSRVFADGGLAYLVGSGLRLAVVDVSDPAAPALVGELPIPGFFAGSLDVRGGEAFLALEGRLQAVDVSTPSNPVMTEGFEAPEEIQDLDLDGTTLYLASPDRVWRYSLADPARPALEGFFAPDGMSVFGNPAFRVAGEGDRVAVVEKRGTVRLFEAPDLALAVETGSFDPGSPAVELFLSGETASLLTLDGRFQAVDLGAAGGPVVRGELALPGPGRGLFAAPGNRFYAVFGDGASGGHLEIIDAADPAAPAALSRTAVAGEPISVRVVETTAFIAANLGDGRWSLHAFDVADPARPRRRGTFTEPGRAFKLEAAAGGLVVASVPDGSLHAFGFDPAIGDLVRGPVHGIPESGDLAALALGESLYFYSTSGFIFFPDLTVFGSKGLYVTEARRGGGRDVTLTMDVQPAEALAEGCRTVPAVGSHPFAENTEVTLTALANADRGWNFLEWTGDAGGTSSTTSLVMDGDKLAVAHFVQPVLTLGARPAAELLCPPEAPERRRIAAATVRVDEVDDWRVSSVAFQGFGSGHEVEDLAGVELVFRGRTLSGAYGADDGRISFAVGERVSFSNPLDMELFYRFEAAGAPCAEVPVKTFGVEIGVGDVAATPETFESFLKEPPAAFRLDSATLACVHNVSEQSGFQGIQEAIDDPGTTRGDTIEACPGLYRESVVADKGLVVRSKEGPEVTVIEAAIVTPGAAANRSRGSFKAGGGSPDVYTVEEDGERVFGFTLRNGRHGLLIRGHADVIVGGPGDKDRNLVSGNREHGIRIEGTAERGVIVNNFIGTDASGKVAEPNGKSGISIAQGSNHVIESNLISGNLGPGIHIQGPGAFSHQVLGNRIGLTPDGRPLGNQEGGVLLAEASLTLIGGEGAGEGNTIAGNGADGTDRGYGIGILSGTRNRILGNSIFQNAGLGIDLSRDGQRLDGVDENDELDADGGANGRQNSPRLTLLPAGGDPSVVTALARLQSKPETTYRLDVYASSSCDRSGHGEGETPVAVPPERAFVTADMNGVARTELALPAAAGSVFTATATDLEGNTSEFSNCAAPIEITVRSDRTPAVAPNEAIEYTVTVEAPNPALIPAGGITVVLEAPEHTNPFIAEALTPGSTAASNGRQIEWTISQLPAAGGAMLKLVVFLPCTVVELSNEKYPDEIILRGSAAFDGIEVPVTHRLDLLKPDLVITGMELTQTIQNLDNEVVLVAKKPAWARAFIQAKYPQNRSRCDVPGVVADFKIGGRVQRSAAIRARGAPANGRPSSEERGKPNNFPNIRRKAHAAQIRAVIGEPRPPERPFEVEATINPDCSRVDAKCPDEGNRETLKRLVEAEPPFKLKLLRVGIQDTQGSANHQFNVDEATATRIRGHVGRILPVGGIDGSTGLKIDTHLFSRQVKSEDLCDEVNLARVIASIQHELSVLARFNGTSVPKDVLYYGLTVLDCRRIKPDGEAGVAPVGSQIAAGDARLATVLHELGHLFGLRHIEPVEPGARCRKQDDPFEPYRHPNGRLSTEKDPSNAKTFYGNDKGMVVPPGDAALNFAFDIMTACENQWVSDVTWDRLRRLHPVGKKKAQQRSGARLDSATPLLVAGTVNLSRGTAELFPFYRLSERTTLEVGGGGDFELRLLGGAATLARYPIAVEELADGAPGSDRFGVFAQSVAYVEGTTHLELLHLGVVLARRTVSRQAPTVTFDPLPSAAAGGERLRLSWSAEDADGDELSYLLAYGADGATFSKVIGINLRRTSLDLDLADLSAGEAARFRVLATDGVHTAAATSEPFTVAPHAPRVFLLRPAEGALLPTGEVLVLEGAASDAEDGFLPDAALVWKGAGGRAIGSGSELAVTGLAAGEHAFTLEATDSDGMTGSADVRIRMAPPDVVHGRLHLSSASHTVAEDESEVFLSVERSGGSAGAAAVAYSTVDGSALSGEDYLAISGSLFWEDGDAEPKVFSVPILRDPVEEGEDLLLVLLHNPLGAVLGEPSLASVTLVDPPAGPPPPVTGIPVLSGRTSVLWALLLALTGSYLLRRRRA